MNYPELAQTVANILDDAMTARHRARLPNAEPLTETERLVARFADNLAGMVAEFLDDLDELANRK